jgi:hypothetical protein
MFIKIVNNLPFNSEIIGSPKGYHPSTLEWFNALKASNQYFEGEYISIHPEHTIQSTRAPKSVNGEIPLVFQQQFSRQTPETFVVNIPEGRSWSDCAVIPSDDRLLAEISRVYVPITEHPIFSKWKLRPASYFNSTVAVMAVLSGDRNYFHWMFEVLPRFELLRLSGIKIEDIDYFFVNDCSYPFQRETLANFGIPVEKIIECTKKSHIKARKLIVPSLPGNTFDLPRWTCDFLRSKFLNDRAEEKFDLKRIYITRSDAQYRKILNEDEIIEFLERSGFQSVTLASMTVSEQISLFSAVDVIIAPHGAGLSNIVFCKPETKIIELFSPKYVKPYYWCISNHIPLDYYLLIGAIDETIEPCSSPEYMNNFSINIENLSKTLNIANIS